MKKLLFTICALGVIGSVWAMDFQVLYQKDGVVITQQDADDFRSGALTQQRFNELHLTISTLVPELQDKGYREYRMAMTWMPHLCGEYADKMITQFAAIKAQGPQPASSAPKAPASSTPAPQSIQPPQPAATSPAATPIKKPVPVAKPAASASKPVPVAVKSTVIVDTKYIIGAACTVLVLWFAYKWYEAWCEDDEEAGKVNKK